MLPGRGTWLIRAVAIAAWTLTALPAFGQGVDEIVARNLEAKGGVEKLKAVTGFKMTGKLVAGGQNVTVTLYMKRPNRLLQEILVGGERLVQAFDGETAWVLNPLLGITEPQAIGGPQARAMREQADFEGPLIDYRARGILVDREPDANFEGRRVHRLKITRKGGAVQRIDIDAETGLEVRSTMEIDQGGMALIVENLMGDYRRVEGLMLPFRLRTLVNGEEQSQLALDVIEVSPTLDEALFKKP